MSAKNPESLIITSSRNKALNFTKFRTALCKRLCINTRFSKRELLLSDATSVIDYICEDYPSMCVYLASCAKIDHSLLSDSTMVRVSNRIEPELTFKKRKAIKDLETQNETSQNSGSSDGNISDDESIERKRRPLSSAFSN